MFARVTSSSFARRRLLASLTGALALAVLPTLPATSSGVRLAPVPAASNGWLAQFNLWRASTGQSSLTENTTWSSGDYNHAVYMVKNNAVTHGETVGMPYYTTSGDIASQNGNIFVSSSTSTTDSQAIDWWMGAPFHAMSMMDPRLATTGFGAYRDTTTSPWQLGAALDVARGITGGGQFPVYFPGNGSTEPLTAYSGNEFPDPQSACPGYSGLPLFVETGANVSTTAGPVHTITANGTSLANCVIDATNTTLSPYMKQRGGVILMPQSPLQSGVTYTVAVTVNAVPYTWSFTVGPFRAAPPGWNSLGGLLTASPAVTSSSATRSDAFVRGSNGALYQNTWNGTAWGGWSSLGGYLTSKAAAVAGNAGRIDVFVRGSDNGLYQETWNGSSWSTWQPLGGILTAGPAVAFRAGTPGTLDVFARGTDNGLWVRESVDGGTTWPTGWIPLGGIITSDPGAVSWGPTRLDVVARGTDNAVWMRSWNASTGWNNWATLGGLATSAPDVTSCASGHLDIFVRGTDGGLWQLGFNATSWTGWKPLGGYWTSAPSAPCRPGTTNIDVFASGADSALWTTSVTGS
jgi:cysteine-rich secretory family protein